MRVVPSDYYQAQVMIDIVKSNGWSYIHTVHTGNYFFHYSLMEILLLKTNTYFQQMKTTDNQVFKLFESWPIKTEFV